jgi:hypothetical protein
MQRGSDKHGFRLDDAMSGEVRGMTSAGHDVRAEEWRSPEPFADDQPVLTPAPDGTLEGGTPEGMSRSDLDDRAELASLLGKEIWPADALVIKERIREGNGPDRIRDLVTALPQGTYENVAEVWAALTGERETQRF